MALLQTVEGKRGTPGRTGFRMAVGGDGALCGTIGGGRVEFDLVEEARAKLRTRDSAILLQRKVHHPNHPDTSGMVCGGSQIVATYLFSRKDLKTVERILASLERERTICLTLSEKGLGLRAAKKSDPMFHFSGKSSRWTYAESLRPADKLFIVGGGHVGLALSRLMESLDLHVVVIDERADVSTFAANDAADEKRVARFRDVGKILPAGEGHYVLIATPGYISDAEALRPLLKKKFAYLGVLGSVRKGKEILACLRKEGYPQKLLSRVRVPAGLPIASQTPAEIAVSIAAEIIGMRNLKKVG